MPRPYPVQKRCVALRTCVACGKTYGNKFGQKNYRQHCSSRCYEREAYRNQFPTRVLPCRECGTTITTKHRRRVFCSKQCCVRHYHKRVKVKHLYGITLETYAAVMASTSGRCSICQQPSDRMTLDHCHGTGQVRGPLCTQCNTGLGMFQDEIAFLLRAVEYLKRHGKEARVA